MSESSISPRVKFGLLGAAVIGGLIAIASMNSGTPAAVPGSQTDASPANSAAADPNPINSTRVDPTPSDPAAANPAPAAPKPRLATTDTIKWNTSLSDALIEAKKTHKLVMVDVYTDWCGYCKIMDGSVHNDQLPPTFKDAEVVAESKKFIDVKANATNDNTLAEQYQISGFPTQLWLDSDGKLISSNTGYSPPEEFMGLMHQAENKYADASGA